MRGCISILIVLLSLSSLAQQETKQKAMEEKSNKSAEPRNEVEPSQTPVFNNSPSVNSNILLENQLEETEEEAPARMLEDLEMDDAVVDNRSVRLSSLVNAFEVQYKASFGASGRTISKSDQKKLDALVKDLETTDKNSFEYHYAAYASGHHDLSRSTHLHQAWKLKPGDPRILDDMVAYYQITDSTSQRKNMSRRLKGSGTIPSGLYEYAKNTLNSVSKNGVLITYGHDDTYPLLIAQDVLGVRTDVKVVSLDHLVNDGYRRRVSSRLGIPYIKSFEGEEAEFLSSVAKSTYSLHVALTVPRQIFSGLSTRLYLVGLAMRYSSSEVKNLKEMADSWSRFDKTKMLKPTSTREKRLYSNYLPMLIKLSTQESVGTSAQKKEWSTQLQLLAKKLGKEEQVSRLVTK